MIYLDHAATSFPKPMAVIEAQTLCMKKKCGNPGRGSHSLALAAAQTVFECREAAARFFGLNAPDRVIFTQNTTASLNFAIKGLLKRGDHVLLSDMEHNAVFRPICKLAREGRITYSLFPTLVHKQDRTPKEICDAICARIRPNTKMLICAHASNICSSVLPLLEIGKLCAEKGILFITDAAQTAGKIPINMNELGIDALCVPGHKGLLGPQGVGLLLLREGLVANTLMEGGSGVDSLAEAMPEEAPERYEVGTLPTPAIAGLCAGIQTVERMGIEAISAHEREWTGYLQERLLSLRGIEVYVPHHVGSVLLFNVRGVPSDRIGRLLSDRGICVRTGYHCAALGHKTLGTPAGGAIRVSVGPWNKIGDADALIGVLSEIVRKGAQ